MAEMDGQSATTEIRRPEKQLGWPRTPVVALTANAMDADRQRALDAGMDDFLAKPYLPEALLEIVRRWLDKGESCGEGLQPKSG